MREGDLIRRLRAAPSPERGRLLEWFPIAWIGLYEEGEQVFQVGAGVGEGLRGGFCGQRVLVKGERKVLHGVELQRVAVGAEGLLGGGHDRALFVTLGSRFG